MINYLTARLSPSNIGITGLINRMWVGVGEVGGVERRDRYALPPMCKGPTLVFNGPMLPIPRDW